MKTRTGIQPDNYPNLAVGKATADADGNVIPDTYAKLGQVVRKDVLVGAISPASDAGRNWLANKQLLTSGEQITASGWYRIAEIPNYCKAKFNIFKQFNHDVGEATTITINSGVANWNYVVINVENSLVGDGSDNYVKQVRFSNNVLNTSGYVDVYIEAAEQNAYWLTVDAEKVYNTDFEIYAFESVTEAVADNAIIVDVPKNGGSNTNKPIYQQGNPVANLSQVVRTDAAQSLTDGQKNTVAQNIERSAGRIVNSGEGWYNILTADTNGYFVADLSVISGYSHMEPTEVKIIAIGGYTVPGLVNTRASITCFSGGALSPSISKVRVRNIGGQVCTDVYIPYNTTTYFNNMNVSLNSWKNIDGTMPQVQPFTFIGTEDDAADNVSICEVIPKGISTNGQIYQQGSPVLVGDQSAIFESDGTTVKKATRADKVFVKTLFKGDFYLETSAKTLTISDGNISDYDEIKIYFQNNVDSSNAEYLLTTIRNPQDIYYVNAVPVVVGEEGYEVTYVTIANGGGGTNEITFTLGKADSAFRITCIEGVLYVYN